MKPLTPAMRELLETMERECGVYAGSGFGNNVSRLVAPRKRGLACHSGNGGRWSITPAGRALLEAAP